MKKEVYLVLCCPRDEFRKQAKHGLKCNLMVYRCNTSPVWATKSRKEAIEDCINYNKMKLNECIYFMLPISLFM